MRFDRLDALRGFAMVWMAAYHFCFDLKLFGLLQADFNNDPFWTLQRTSIVTLFLACAGAGQALAMHQGQTQKRFWWRWGQIAACALVVTASSWWMFPRSYIYFGVLHGMAVMLLLMRPTARWGRWLWLAGLVAVVSPWVLAHPVFDQPWWHWLGLMTHKPVTEDYVPVLPWVGVMWWGLAAGQWLVHERPAWFTGGVSAVARPLVALGRWPLSFYMLHQPVLIGSLMLAAGSRG